MPIFNLNRLFLRSFLRNSLIIGVLIFSILPLSAQSSTLNIYHQDWIDFNKNEQKDIYEDPTAPINARIKDLIAHMNMEEKTMQLVTLYGYGRVAEDEIPNGNWKNELWKDGLANIDEASNGVYEQAAYKFPYQKHTWALNKIQQFFVEETRLGIPVEFTNEGIRGLNHYKATSFPAQIGMGCTWNNDLLYETGKIIGAEAHALGYHNIYSPVLDIARDQRWGRIVESFSEDPFLISNYGIQISKGINENGVVNSLKHYAAYSAPKGGRDGHVRLDPHISPRELHQLYLRPFREVIRHGGALGIMASYNDYDGVPIIGSKYFLSDLLRDEYGFKGYVVSDSDALHYLYSKHRTVATYQQAIVKALKAGLNVRTTFNHPENFINPLRKAIAEGEISEEIIDQRLSEVLFVKFKEGLFDQPYREEKGVDEKVRTPNHLATALQASRESIVLLKNDNQALPLDINQLKKVLVCGPTAKSKTSSISRYGALGTDIISGYDGIKEFLSGKAALSYTQGCKIKDENFPWSEVYPQELSEEERSLIQQAVDEAKESDVVIAFLGEDESMVGENLSRSSLQLPGRQIDLLKALLATGKPIIVVLINGRPLSINLAANEADAILEAWFPGEFGGTAIAEVIFGNYNPGGKLSTTFPRTVGQIPLNFPYKPHSQRGQANDGPHGTGDSRSVDPLFYFGHGLSYTTFEYSNLEVINELKQESNKLKISFDLRNSGVYAGDEVPQLYVHDEIMSVVTYDWQLKAYDRVHLQPGETKRISFELRPLDLTLINEVMEEVTEAGEFKFRIGSSSNDIRLEGSFIYED